MFRSLALLIVLAAPTLAAAASTRCSQPNTDLAVVLDSSHSISEEDFTLEKEGFARALEDPSKTPQDGSVCVTVIEFNDRADVRVPYRCIGSTADAAAIAGELRAIALPRGDNETGVDLALATATNELAANARPNARQVISLATDGLPNVTDDCNVRPIPSCPACASLDAAVAAAKAAGIDELSIVTVEDGENVRGPLGPDDFVRFYGCRVFADDEVDAPGVVTVRDFDEFTRVVANTVATVGCGTRVDLADATALPGGAADVTATLASGVGTAVRTAGADLAVDDRLASGSCADCVLAPGVQAALACDPSPGGPRATVTSNGPPLPDGALFTCRFGISSTVALGTVVTVENRPHATAGDGATLAAVGRNGSVEVTSCPQHPSDCADGGRSTLRLSRARFVAAETGTTAMRLRATLSSADLGTFDSTRAVAFVQVRADATDPGMCVEVPLAAFQRRGRALVFRGRRRAIASAKGLDRVVLRFGPGGTVRLRARGGALEMSPPGAGVVHVGFGLREPDGEPDLCALTDRPFRSVRKAIVFP